MGNNISPKKLEKMEQKSQKIQDDYIDSLEIDKMEREKLDELETNLKSLTTKSFLKRDIIAVINVVRRKIEEK